MTARLVVGMAPLVVVTLLTGCTAMSGSAAPSASIHEPSPSVSANASSVTAEQLALANRSLPAISGVVWRSLDAVEISAANQGVPSASEGDTFDVQVACVADRPGELTIRVGSAHATGECTAAGARSHLRIGGQAAADGLIGVWVTRPSAVSWQLVRVSG